MTAEIINLKDALARMVGVPLSQQEHDMKTYMVCDENGNALTEGLQEYEARFVAQRMADDRGESVWLSRDDDDGMGEEIAPEMTSAGYVVCNNEAIWGVGETADDAWANFRQAMDSAAINLVAPGEDIPEDGPNWVRESDYKARPATAALLKQVEEQGGDCAWRVTHGIACTVEEAE